MRRPRKNIISVSCITFQTNLCGFCIMYNYQHFSNRKNVLNHLTHDIYSSSCPYDFEISKKPFLQQNDYDDSQIKSLSLKLKIFNLFHYRDMIRIRGRLEIKLKYFNKDLSDWHEIWMMPFLSVIF